MSKIIAIILSCLFLISMGGCKKHKSEYRTDLEPIINRFSVFTNIQKCYWKTSVDGENNRVIPTPDYWMMGFFVLNSEQFEFFKAEYEWTFPEMNFSEYGSAVDPNIVDSNNEKKWGYNQQFNDLAIPEKFWGHVFLDVNNGIIFFAMGTH